MFISLASHKYSASITQVQVWILRHAVDAISKRSAELRFPQLNEQSRTVRAAMALISAHSEETSDAIYGGDEEAIYEASVQTLELYLLCSVIFNDFVGITTPEARAGIVTPQRLTYQTPPTVPKDKRRVEEQGFSEEQGSCLDCISQTTSGFQWPPSRSLFEIDEHASSVSDQDQIDLLWSELKEGIEDVPRILTSGRKRAAAKSLSPGNPSPVIRRQSSSPSLGPPPSTPPPSNSPHPLTVTATPALQALPRNPLSPTSAVAIPGMMRDFWPWRDG
jgi:hypothetical protein